MLADNNYNKKHFNSCNLFAPFFQQPRGKGERANKMGGEKEERNPDIVYRYGVDKSYINDNEQSVCFHIVNLSRT